jgi:ribosomal protein S18 acetylase RimI-like enzyme
VNAPDDDQLAIVRAGAERIDDLQPLWEALSRHHGEVAPELAAIGERRRLEDSWAVRRALYESLFSEPGTFVLIAELGPSPVGYALVHVRGPEETWSTGDRVAELETLTVLPDSRGRGVGTALVEAVFSELRALGVRQWAVGAIAANADAIRFYERFEVLPFMVAFIGNVPEG